MKEYHDVYLLAPKDDPRDVVPRVVDEFKALGLQVTLVDPAKSLDSQGTGFLISDSGYVLTCAHVIGAEKVATVWMSGTRYDADVVSNDSDKDIAILKIKQPGSQWPAPLSFRNDHKYALGADVFTIGYPLSHLLGSSARFTKGSVSAASGLNDDPKQIQVSAEIQPGNSGGPLLDKDGLVLGMVAQTLNPVRVLQESSALPQNVNFAIKGDVMLDYLRSAQPDLAKRISYDKSAKLEDVAAAVVKVMAGNVTEDMLKRPKMLAVLRYRSHWDIWFRFNLFVLQFYDFDSHAQLFAAGQGRDNLVSTEDVVIKDTFKKIRETLEMK